MKLEMLRVYLDNCCYNRPFDDQSSKKILFETEAKLFIQEKIKLGELELVWSFILDYENNQNMDSRRKEEIFKFEKYSKVYFIGTNDTQILSEKLYSYGIKKKDSIHLASAIETNCDYFITTDIGIIKKKSFFSEIAIINPIDFIIQIGETK